jgi:quinoprotein glucose dehydrogenase
MKGKFTFFLPIILLIIGIGAFTSTNTNEDWPEYLGGLDRNHFTKLNQITLQNASQLKMALTYSMPD